MRLAAGKALAWEFCRRGWFFLLLAIVANSVFTAVLFKALPGVDNTTPDELMKIVVRVFPLLLINEMMMFVAMVAQSHGGTIDVFAPREYRLPLSNWGLIGWRMTIGSLAVVVMQPVLVVAVGSMTGVYVPILIPILFIILALVGFQGIVLICTGHIVLRIVCGFSFGLGMYFWAWSIYHKFNDWPKLDWAHVALLCGAIVTMYFAAVIGAARERRGDATGIVGLRELWDKLVWRIRGRREGFDSAPSAQFWFERRVRGGSYITLSSLPFILTMAILASGFEPRQILETSFGLTMFCLLAGAFPIGLLIGHIGKLRSGPVIDSFRATRPLSDEAIASQLLRSAAREIQGAWLVIALMAAIVFLVLLATGRSHEIGGYLKNMVHDNLLPGTILIPLYIAGAVVLQWGLLCIGMSLMMTGRNAVLGTFMWVVIGSVMTVAFTLPFRSIEWLRYGIAFGVGGGFLIVAQWIMFAGWRRGYVRFWIAALPLILGGVSLIAYPARHWNGIIPVIIVVTFVAAVGFLLATLPFAAAPLALSYNRHR